MLFGDPEFSRLNHQTQLSIIKAVQNVDIIECIIGGIIIFLFIHPLTALISQAFFWNYLIWNIPWDIFSPHEFTSMQCFQLITGYFLCFFAIFIALEKNNKGD